MPLIGTRGAASAQGFGEFAQQASGVQANAIDFDGTNDYLRRTSDLTGNTASKTFTFSTWIWQADTATGWLYVVSNGTNQRFTVRVVTGNLEVVGTANTNSEVLRISCSLAAVARTQTFYHVLVSIDMANAANRSIYINDIAQSLTVTTYTNALIPFNQVDHVVAGTQGGSAGDRGRLSNVFLDYTYRDLSVTANRRLFVTADLKPAAGQAALNPILYLPMSDPTQPGLNQGTGGNFTLTGVVARSGRGPNQYNAPYATYNGTTQYVRKGSSMTGAADGKQFTFHCVVNGTAMQNGPSLFQIYDGNLATTLFQIYLGTRTLKILGKTNAGTTVLNATSPANTFVNGRNYVIDISIDMSNTANRFVYINGTAVSMTWTTYTNSNIAFVSVSGSSFTVNSACAQYDNAGEVNYFAGTAGAFWFNTSYIDLSVASNLAKFVTGTGIDAKPSDLGATGNTPTGSTPLVYLPMYGNAVGVNYGTGGNFNDISTVLPGARGPNEFWGNKASGFNGSSNIYLTKATALSGVPSSGSTLSIVCWFNLTDYTTTRTIFGTNSAGTMTLQVTSGGNLFMWLDSSGYVQFSQVVPTGSWVCLMFSKTGSTYTVYVNDTVHTVDVANSFNRGNSVTYTNTPVNIATRYDGSSTGEKWYGSLSEFYFTTEYIDFSQEANRLKFRDCFGNPTDLPSAITAGTVPNPAIYMRFPPTSFGTNSGTGGNFTVTGTITDGGQL